MKRIAAAVLLLAESGTRLAAQQGTPAANEAQPDSGITVRTLKVRVLQGDEALNIIGTTVITPVVVEIRNQDDRPVEGAAITFSLPSMGAGGFFEGQKLTQTVRSNYQGQAGMSGFRPNSEPGRFTIKISARLGNQIGDAMVHQTNATTLEGSEKSGRLSRKWLWLSALAGTGVGLGVYFGSRNSSTAAAGPTLTLVPGSVTIGGPR